MSDIVPVASPFDSIRRGGGSAGPEYWSARELQPLLGYEKWERFEDAIERAIVSARNAGHDPDQAFSRRREAFGRTNQMGTDYYLTRYGPYQAAVESGYLTELPSSHYHPRTGELVLDPPQVRVTVKGLHVLHRRLRGAGDVDLRAAS